MTTKLSLALAIGLVYPLVQLNGFNPLQPTEDGIQVLIFAYGLLPIPFKLIAAWMIWHFPLDSQQLSILQRVKPMVAVYSGTMCASEQTIKRHSGVCRNPDTTQADILGYGFVMPQR